MTVYNDSKINELILIMLSMDTVILINIEMSTNVSKRRKESGEFNNLDD